VHFNVTSSACDANTQSSVEALLLTQTHTLPERISVEALPGGGCVVVATFLPQRSSSAPSLTAIESSLHNLTLAEGVQVVQVEQVPVNASWLDGASPSTVKPGVFAGIISGVLAGVGATCLAFFWWLRVSTRRRRNGLLLAERELSRVLDKSSPLSDGRTHAYDIFLSYRVATDSELVERLYDKLTALGVRVWWDVKCLPSGKPWEEGFADGLFHSAMIVPVISQAAIASWASLNGASRCDNLLLEVRMALELVGRGEIARVCPVLVGDLEWVEGHGELYADFFRAGVPTCPDVAVDAVERKATEHLQRAGKAGLDTPMPVDAVLAELLRHQGVKLVGVKRQALEHMVHTLGCHHSDLDRRTSATDAHSDSGGAVQHTQDASVADGSTARTGWSLLRKTYSSARRPRLTRLEQPPSPRYEGMTAAELSVLPPTSDRPSAPCESETERVAPRNLRRESQSHADGARPRGESMRIFRDRPDGLQSDTTIEEVQKEAGDEARRLAAARKAVDARRV